MPRLAVRSEQASTCLERTRRLWAPRPPPWRCTRSVRRNAVTPWLTSCVEGVRLDAARGTAAQQQSRPRAVQTVPCKEGRLTARLLLRPRTDNAGACRFGRHAAHARECNRAAGLRRAAAARRRHCAPWPPGSRVTPRAVSPPGWAGTGCTDSAVIAPGARSPPGMRWRRCSALHKRHRGKQAAAVSKAGCLRGSLPPQASRITGAARRRHGTPGGCSPPRRRRMRMRARGRCSRRAWQARSSCLWVRPPCSRRPAAPRAPLAHV